MSKSQRIKDLAIVCPQPVLIDIIVCYAHSFFFITFTWMIFRLAESVQGNELEKIFGRGETSSSPIVDEPSKVETDDHNPLDKGTQNFRSLSYLNDWFNLLGFNDFFNVFYYLIKISVSGLKRTSANLRIYLKKKSCQKSREIVGRFIKEEKHS